MPPPVIYLLPFLRRIIIPPVAVYVSLHFIRTAGFGLVTSQTHRIAISVFCLPLWVLLESAYSDFKDSREASRNGAVLPPQLKHGLGGFSIASKLVENLKSGYQSDTWLEWVQQYGTIYSFKMFFVRRIFTIEPGYIKAILSTEFDNFEKGRDSARFFHTMFGSGIFNSDGETWKFHRAATRPYFTKERIRHVDIFDRHAEDVLVQASTRLREGFPVDFQDMVARFTLDAATEFLFDNDVCSLSAGLPYPDSDSQFNQQHDHPANVFARAFAKGQDLSAIRSRRGALWPLYELWTDQVKKLRDVLDDFIDPILDRAVEQRNSAAAAVEEKSGKDGSADNDDSTNDESFLDHLVKLTDDKTILRDAIINTIVAGRDTTAATMTFAVYMMCEHPDMLHRLREEILSVVGSSRRPEFEDIQQMRYLRAFINETLRLYPTVPLNGRCSKKATVWPSVTPGDPPIYIPANTRVSYNVFLMHTMKEYWGPDAHKFDPDRFLDERLKKYLVPNPFIFLPFNAGPRICLGQQFAYHEMSFLLVRLLQRFSGFSLATDAMPADSKPPAEWYGASESRKGLDRIWSGSHLTMYVKGGLWLRMTEASANETG